MKALEKNNHNKGRGAMARAWRFANVAVSRAASNPLVAGFSEKYDVSPLSILEYCFDVVSSGKTLYHHMLCLTQVLISTR